MSAAGPRLARTAVTAPVVGDTAIAARCEVEHLVFEGVRRERPAVAEDHARARRLLPPRILVVSAEQWPRALLRAQLREAGYDAIGASALSRALRHPPHHAERGPVRLVVVDSAAAAADPETLTLARRRYPGVAFVLIHRAGPVPPGPWAATLQRPVSIGDIVATVRQLVPLSATP